MGADLEARVLALAVYAGLVGVPRLTRWPGAPSRGSRSRSTAVVLAVLATGLSGDERTTAMVLTVVGTAICAVAVTTRDRGLLGWAGALVLGAATVIRVALDVQAPELYTLPAAALLVAAGVWRIRTDSETSSFATLGSGLTLALLPSLLLALEEPVSLRGALVGAASVLVLAAGVAAAAGRAVRPRSGLDRRPRAPAPRADRRRGPPLDLPRRGRARPARWWGSPGRPGGATSSPRTTTWPTCAEVRLPQ